MELALEKDLKEKLSKGGVLVEAHKHKIYVKDIETLFGNNWLNDQIINVYMQVCKVLILLDNK